MGKSSKTQKTETKSTSTNAPWAPQEKFYLDIYDRANKAMEATNGQSYQGPLTAGPNANQYTAASNLANNNFAQGNGALLNALKQHGDANQKLTGYGDYKPYEVQGNDAASIRAGADKLASGAWLNPETNPYLKTNVETALGQASRNYNQTIAPNLGDAAIKSGAYGGSRNGIVEALAAGETDRNMKETAAQMYGANYEAERQRMMQAPSQYATATGIDQSNYTTGLQGHTQNINNGMNLTAALGNAAQTQKDVYQGINTATMQQIAGQASAGQQQQAWEQAANDDAYLKWQMQQAAPWAGLSDFTSILGAGGFGTQTGTSTTTAPNPNYKSPLQTAMGIGSSLLGFAGMPAFGAAGTMGGSLLSMFGGGARAPTGGFY